MSDVYQEANARCVKTGTLAGLVPAALKIPVIKRDCQTQGNNSFPTKEKEAKSDLSFHQVAHRNQSGATSSNKPHLSLQQKEVIL